MHDFWNDAKRAAEISEAAHAESAIERPFRKPQLDLGRDGERAFGPGQKAGQILICRITKQGSKVISFWFRRPWNAQRPKLGDGFFMNLAELQKVEKAVAARQGLRFSLCDGPKRTRCPSATMASADRTLSRIEPWRSARKPLALLPSMPPIVAWAADDPPRRSRRSGTHGRNPTRHSSTTVTSRSSPAMTR